MNLDRKQGEEVVFHLGDGKKTYRGKICGQATVEMMVVGLLWIVELLDKLDYDEYKYSHIVVFENWIVSKG